MRPVILAFLAGTMAMPTSVSAADSRFLQSIEGSWAGQGMVLTRIGGRSINVDCNIDFDAGATSLDMGGSCRALVVASRAISASLKASGNRYRGTYTGPSGQPSSLSGSLRGETLNLAVRWAREINGDRTATMTIARLGDNRLRLQTVDIDPASGKTVVTSRIDLSR